MYIVFIAISQYINLARKKRKASQNKYPSKIFIRDIGLAQVMSGTNVVGTKTMLAGSPGFQPPEQQLKSESVGLPSDIYAIGAVLLVIFGETQVWPGLSPYQIMFKVHGGL